MHTDATSEFILFYFFEKRNLKFPTESKKGELKQGGHGWVVPSSPG